MSDNGMKAAGNSEYRRQGRRRLLILVFCAFLLLLLFLFSLKTGSYRLSTVSVLQALFDSNTDPVARHLVMQIRLPRCIAATLAGAGLSVVGAVMQNLLKNPLAAPSTIGVSQGAAFGAACAIILMGAGQAHVTGNEAVTISSHTSVVAAAFGGSLSSIILILLLAGLGRLPSESFVLAGVAISAFLGAATMLLQYLGDELQVAATVFWTFGDLGKAGWHENLIMAVILIPILICLWGMSWHYNALLWGDEVAMSLGVRLGRLRLASLAAACLVVAVITAFLGIISFVGLLVPHLMRRIIGNDQRFLLPASLLGGSCLLLSADLLARIVIAPLILPVGIITAFVGAPLFLYLLVRRPEYDQR